MSLIFENYVSQRKTKNFTTIKKLYRGEKNKESGNVNRVMSYKETMFVNLPLE